MTNLLGHNQLAMGPRHMDSPSGVIVLVEGSVLFIPFRMPVTRPLTTRRA
jgi:hypothetical protein